MEGDAQEDKLWPERWAWGRVVLLEMGFAWAVRTEGWREQPHGMPHRCALGPWRSLSSSTDPSCGACPALPGVPWGVLWQQVLMPRQDPKNPCWGLQHPCCTGVRGIGITLTGRQAEAPEDFW